MHPNSYKIIQACDWLTALLPSVANALFKMGNLCSICVMFSRNVTLLKTKPTYITSPPAAAAATTATTTTATAAAANNLQHTNTHIRNNSLY